MITKRVGEDDGRDHHWQCRVGADGTGAKTEITRLQTQYARHMYFAIAAAG